MTSNIGNTPSSFIQQQGTTHCFNCKKTLEIIKQCAKCKIAKYCNKDCQRSHWTKHKITCSPLKSDFELIFCEATTTDKNGNKKVKIQQWGHSDRNLDLQRAANTVIAQMGRILTSS